MSSTSICKGLSQLPWQVGAFCLALLVYGVSGSPTPDEIGVSEVLTCLLLLASIRLPDVRRLPAPVIIFAIYGLSIPVLTGVLAGHSMGLILRDLIAFGFLLLPVFFASSNFRDHRQLVIFTVVLVGLMFSIRALMPYGPALFHPASWLGLPPADLLYLANSPEVLFSGLMLLGTGGFMIWAGQGMIKGMSLAVLAGLPLIAMAVMMQRAGLGCIVLAGLIWAALGSWHHPARMGLTAGLLGLLALPLVSLGSAITSGLILKTEMVGFNSRTQEWATVLDLIGQSPWTALTGLGWGASFENPAVGNLTVNYTHSLVSALLLKTGLAGVLAMLAYLWMLAKQAVPELWRRPVLMVALAAPLGIGLVFYASYKSLGFGMLLFVLSLSAPYRKLEKNQVDMP